MNAVMLLEVLAHHASGVVHAHATEHDYLSLTVVTLALFLVEAAVRTAVRNG